MIDFHTHVLPGIDDGSQDLEESKRLLEESHVQNVEKLIATPHFYATESSFGRFLRHREESLQKLLAEKEQWGQVPELFVGAEVYYFPGVSKAERLPELCIRGTNVLLLEMPFAQWTSEMYREVRNIIEKRKLQVVLAHVERYFDDQKDRSVWEDIWDLPLHPQLNAGSFLKRGRRKFCLRFLKEHGDVLLGSDCHNMEYRPPNLLAAGEVIEEKLGEEYLARTNALAEKLLSGADVW